MAIKEFIIGPQNYFEAGYFDGDYTLPNVSKFFLECDVDQTKGGRVITGEYYLGDYIDGTYYHDNSIRAALTCNATIVKLATVSLSGYYEYGYHTSGYYRESGSVFTLTAELTQIGEDIFGDATLASTATMAIAVGRIRSAASVISTAFTQTVNASRTRDIDLYAFSEGSVTVTVNRIRNTTVVISSQFTQTAIGSKTNGIELFAFSQASIAVQVNRIRDNNISQSTQFNIAVDYTRIIQGDSDADGIFSTNVVYTRSRDFLAEFQTAFSLTCIISHIEGADLVAQNFASLTATANVTKNIISSISSSATLSALTGLIKQVASSISSQFSVIASSRVYVRPTTVSYGTNSSLAPIVIDSGTKKFGSGSVVYQAGYYTRPETEIIWDGTNFKAWTTGNSVNGSEYEWSSSDGLTWTRASTTIPYAGNIKVVEGNNPGGQYSKIYFLWAPGQTIYYSFDLTTWTAWTRQISNLVKFDAVIAGGYLYYAMSSGITSFAIESARYFFVNDNPTIASSTFYNRNVWISPAPTSSSGLRLLAVVSDATNSTGNVIYTTNGAGGSGQTIINRYGQGSTTLFSGATYGVDATYANGKYAILRSDGYVFSSSTYNTGYTDSTNSYSGATFIQGLNGNWIVGTSGSTYFGSNLNSLSVSNRSLTQEIVYGSGKYLYIDYDSRWQGLVNYSTDFTTWNQNVIEGAEFLPNKITYTSNVNFKLMKSIDFWMIRTGGGPWYQQIVNFNDFTFTLGFNNNYFYATANDNQYTLPLGPSGITGGWDHIRFVVNGSAASIYINGTRRSTTSSFGAISGTLNSVDILYGFFLDTDWLYIDELLITKTLLNDPSATTITVPTQQWTNDTNTLLLSHFNGDFTDDSRFNVVEQATLTSTSTLTATSTVSYASNLGTLSTSASMVVYASKNAEIVLSAFTNASLGVVYSRIRYQTSTITSEFSQSTTVSKTLDTPANLSCSATQSIVYNRIRDNQITTDAIFSELTVGAISRDVAVNMSMVASLSAAIPDRTRSPVLALSSSFALSTTPIATLDAIALVMSAGTMTTVAKKTTDITKTLSSVFTFTADNQGSTIRVNALVMSAGTMTTVAKKTTDLSKTLASEFTVNAETIDSLNIRASANFSSEFALSVTNYRIRFAAITADAIASELTVITKTAGNTVTMSSTATMSVSANRTRGVDSAISSTATLGIINSRLRLSAASINSNATLTAIGFSNSDVPVVMALTTSMTAIGQLTKETLLLAFSNASLSVSANRTRSTSVSMSSSVQVTITSSRVRYVQITTNSIASSMIVIGAIKGIIQTLPIVSTMTTVFDVLHTTDNVYIIPFENRAYIINQETRTKKITSETRQYKIRR